MFRLIYSHWCRIVPVRYENQLANMCNSLQRKNILTVTDLFLMSFHYMMMQLPTHSSKHSNSGVLIPDSSESANIKLFKQEKTSPVLIVHLLRFGSDITAHECSFFGSQMLVCPRMHHQGHQECFLVTNCFTMQQQQLRKIKATWFELKYLQASIL